MRLSCGLSEVEAQKQPSSEDSWGILVLLFGCFVIAPAVGTHMERLVFSQPREICSTEFSEYLGRNTEGVPQFTYKEVCREY
jgi:hypothetical protein